jgi:hypothetical protein
MSPHPNEPDQPMPPPSFSHAQGNLYGPAPFDGAQIHRERSSPGLILAAIGLALALIGVCVKMLLPAEEAAPDTTQAAPAMAIPENARNASDDGWQMKISPRWKAVNVPKRDADAGWTTDTSKFPGIVIVGIDPQPSSTGIEDYLQSSLLNLRAEDPAAEVLSTDIFQAPDHEYGRVEYTTRLHGRAVQGVIYVAASDDGFINAGYVSTLKTFDDTAAKVEPFLATAQNR